MVVDNTLYSKVYSAATVLGTELPIRYSGCLSIFYAVPSLYGLQPHIYFSMYKECLC